MLPQPLLGVSGRKKVADMRRTILLAGVLPFVSAFLGGVLAFSFVVPGIVEAQETRIRAESVVVVDDSGMNRAAMETGPGARSAVVVRSQGEITRVSLNIGGGAGTRPDAAFLSVFAPEGPPDEGGIPAIARLGTGDDGDGSVMYLRDRQGGIRIWLRVDGDGNPSMEIRDASGNVTWRAE